MGDARGRHSFHPKKVTLATPNSSSNSSMAMAPSFTSGAGSWETLLNWKQRGWPEAPHINTSQPLWRCCGARQAIRDRAGAKGTRTLCHHMFLQSRHQSIWGMPAPGNFTRKIMGKPGRWNSGEQSTLCPLKVPLTASWGV